MAGGSLLNRLEKGNRVTLGVVSFRLGLGWDPDESKSPYDFDLDVSAFMLGKNKKIITDDYLVFYGSEKRVLPTNLTVLEVENDKKYPPYEDEEDGVRVTKSSWREQTRPVDPEFSVIGSIDDMDGSSSSGGDDETMDINLSKVRDEVVEIIVVVSIYKHDTRRQNFGQVNNSYVRIYKPSTPSLDEYRFDLTEDYSDCASVEFCRIYRHNGEWKLHAMGDGYKGGLEELVKKYS
jgi:tellurium resistance protein TerD